MSFPNKAMIECLDYNFDFKRAVETETIIDVDIVITPQGLTQYAPYVIQDNIVKLFLSGGQAGTTYRIVVHITTNQGRIFRLSETLKVYL